MASVAVSPVALPWLCSLSKISNRERVLRLGLHHLLDRLVGPQDRPSQRPGLLRGDRADQQLLDPPLPPQLGEQQL